MKLHRLHKRLVRISLGSQCPWSLALVPIRPIPEEHPRRLAERIGPVHILERWLRAALRNLGDCSELLDGRISLNSMILLLGTRPEI